MSESPTVQVSQPDPANLPGQDLFHLLTQTIREVFWVREIPSERVLYVSPAAKEVWGVPAHELYGTPDAWFDSIHPDDRERVLRVIASKPQTTRGELEYRIVHPDGRVTWVRDRAYPMYDPNGQIRAVFGVARDVTERHRAEEALRHKEEQYRAVLDHINDVVFRTENGRWTYLNAAWTKLTGFPVEECIGRLWNEFGHPEDLELQSAMISEAPDIVRYEMRCRTRDRGYRWMEITVAPIRYKDRSQTGSFGSMHDITERKEVMARLEKALEKERELHDLKSRFIRTVSHEVGTPLATIQISLDIMEMYGERWDPATAAEQIRLLRTATASLNALLQEVLSFERMQAGEATFRPTQQDIVPIVRSVLDEIRNGIGYNHQFQAELPETLDWCVDDGLYRMIVRNLLSNAAKYSDPGSKVHLHLSHENDHLVLSVQDSGIGIPEADLAHLFEPFHRGQNVGVRRGEGLGLAIARHATERHRGTIEVTSTVGNGTHFLVKLPILQA